jgi:metal-dependent amidase/aminoacylase/carboxypeptidase family protein
MEEQNLPGSVWVLHAPAEEIPPHAKMAMTKAGYFDEVDFIIRSHGTSHRASRKRAGLGNCCMLCEITLYEFFGSPAHGTRAWQGRDAHDAARLFFTAVDMLREHSEPSFRFMGTISKIGTAPNVTNDYVEVDYVLRNADRTKQAETVKKAEQLDTIAKAAAMATFTEVKISRYGHLYNGIESGWLQALTWYYTNEYGDAEAISDELSGPSGWDETGIGAVNVPGVQIAPAVANIPEVAGHSHENAAITISPEGHKGLVQTAKIGAAVALRLVLDPDLRAKVKEEQAQWQRYAVEEGLITEEMIRN